MNMAPTGSARRESYSYTTTSRMTNTYIANGEDRNEDIIASIEYGLYAKAMGGGSVNPATGEFNFAVQEGYLIRNGRIAEPVRGASLVGKGSEIIQKIDMVVRILLRFHSHQRGPATDPRFEHHRGRPVRREMQWIFRNSKKR